MSGEESDKADIEIFTTKSFERSTEGMFFCRIM